MGKFILIFFAVLVLLFSAFSFVLGLARRFLGFVPRTASSRTGRKEQQTTGAGSVLYHDSRTEVLRGESTPASNNNYTNIRDASFTEGKTDTSPRR